MTKLRVPLFTTVILLTWLSGCGGGGRLVSISIDPATANAQPGAAVQFSATGTYSDSTRVNALHVLWSIGDPFAPHPMVVIPNYPIIDADNGLAQCFAPGTFTVTVYATAPIDPNMPLSQMSRGNSVSGTAQLVCP